MARHKKHQEDPGASLPDASDVDAANPADTVQRQAAETSPPVVDEEDEEEDAAQLSTPLTDKQKFALELKKAIKDPDRPEFEVPVELSPGVQRAGVGFYRVGARFRWPDRATKKGDVAHALWIPCNKAAERVLADHHSDEAVLARKNSNLKRNKRKPLTEI